ncbi:MAG: ATP-binding cassette domain-containing protein, partial [Oscillospiraceae bacterium]
MIKLENVSYVYMKGGPFEKTAIENVNIEIEHGEFIGLIGHTGSGKSTLIQLLNGLLKPTTGSVFIEGKNIADKAVKLRDIRFDVGLVMQYPEYQLFEETVFKDIAFGPKNMKLSKEEIDNRVNFAATLCNVETLLEENPYNIPYSSRKFITLASV